MWGVQVISVRRTWRTVRSVGSPGYECEEDREDSEECGESRWAPVSQQPAHWDYSIWTQPVSYIHTFCDCFYNFMLINTFSINCLLSLYKPTSNLDLITSSLVVAKRTPLGWLLFLVFN